MENLSATRAELQESWQRLCQRWQGTTALWSDPMHWQFEREFWQPLETQVLATMNEMQKLADIVAQARRRVK